MEGMEMRRIALLAALITALTLTGCVNVNITIKTGSRPSDAAEQPDSKQPAVTEGPAVKNVVEGDFGPYYEMSDGTWMYNGYYYKHRLEISGRMNNAAEDSTFIYLSNLEDIPFQRAVMASGLSSDLEDYFKPEEAVFVGWSE